MAKNFWEEFVPDGEEKLQSFGGIEDYSRLVAEEREKRRQERALDPRYEVGVIPDPSPEILEMRDRYVKDYTIIHPEVFPYSTGLKPLGIKQMDAVRHSQYFVQQRSNFLKVEPRGFGKTSRSINEATLGILQGFIRYLVIVASNVEKAEEIITSVMTELFTNDKLFDLYPRQMMCFRKTEKDPRNAIRQTYNGNPTYLYYNNGFIVMPYIDGEVSSGAIIDIRARKNVRGIYHTIESGEFAGTRQRPTHIILDDIQTDEEAENPKTADKIIRTIKRSIMRSGGPGRKPAIMMNATPIAPGDVTHHFLLHEPWPHVVYKMLETRSQREDLWFGDYQNILLNFNKEKPGDMLRAAKEARDFYVANREQMDKGAVANWEWCYDWESPEGIEISAIQHAYNIMILEGMDVFEAECQCNVSAANIDESITYCDAKIIAKKQNSRKRYVPQTRDRNIVTHIDVNQPFLTYMTVSSPNELQPSILDYGSLPEYQVVQEKRKAVQTLSTYQAHKTGQDNLLLEDVIYLSVKQLLMKLAARRYKREDGIEFGTDIFLVDSRWMQNEVFRAIRDSGVPNCYAMQNQSFKAKDKPLNQKSYSEGSTMYNHCVLLPTKDRMLRLTTDNNYFKTQAHILFSREAETVGSATWFQEEYPNQHYLPALHFNSETPLKDTDPKSGYTITIWDEGTGDIDNEFEDNFCGCLAALAMRNVDFTYDPKRKLGNKQSVTDYIKSQKG